MLYVQSLSQIELSKFISCCMCQVNPMLYTCVNFISCCIFPAYLMLNMTGLSHVVCAKFILSGNFPVYLTLYVSSLSHVVCVKLPYMLHMSSLSHVACARFTPCFTFHMSNLSRFIPCGMWQSLPVFLFKNIFWFILFVKEWSSLVFSTIIICCMSKTRPLVTFKMWTNGLLKRWNCVMLENICFIMKSDQV